MTTPADDVARGRDATDAAQGHGRQGDSAPAAGPFETDAKSQPCGPIDFALIVPRYESALLRYVGQLLGRGDSDLEDIVQDAFLRLHKYAGENGEGSVQNVSTWLFRVAHNLTMDTLRKRKVRRRVQSELIEGARAAEPQPGKAGPGGDAGAQPRPSAASLPDAKPVADYSDTLGDMERREACKHAMSELETLPEPQRQAVMLKMIEGMTIRQIAQVTETSIGNVGYRISQGLAELSRRLKKSGVI
ncbi:MAG: sigma-70 family RNA polymerase sigma factor [Phycisphaeraceae bacterium]